MSSVSVHRLQHIADLLEISRAGNSCQLICRIEAAIKALQSEFSEANSAYERLAAIIDTQGDALAASNSHLRNMMIGCVVFPLANAAIYYGIRAVIDYAHQFFGQKDLINKKQQN